MNNFINNKLKFRFFNLLQKHKYVLLIFILAGYLIFKGLGYNYFWDDEANTAVFAKNLLNLGSLTAWDGRNLIAYQNGFELNDSLVNIYMPPLQYYVTALSFYLFGFSTVAARLPFAICGLLSLLIFWLILKELGLDKKIAYIALLLCVLSPSFLLFVRQARYYSLSILLALCLYYYYLKFLNTRTVIFFVLFISSSILFFYSNYLSAVSILITMAATHLLFHYKKKDVKYLVIAAILFIVNTLPYLIFSGTYGKIMKVIAGNNESLLSERIIWLFLKLGRTVILFFYSLRELNRFNWFPWIIALGLLYQIFLSKNRNKLFYFGKEWIAIICSFIFFVSFFSPQPISLNAIVDIRYLVILLPFLYTLIAVFLFHILKLNKIIFIVLFILVIFTNIFSVFSFNQKITFDLVGYFNEIHHNYLTPYEGLEKFFKDKVGQDDLVFIIPEYMYQSLIFYSGDKIKIRGILDKKTYLPIKRIEELSPDLFIENAIPDWIIICGLENLEEGIKFDLRELYFKHFSSKGARYNLCEVLENFWSDGTRPELLWHSFGPVEDFDHFKQGILVFKRIH